MPEAFNIRNLRERPHPRLFLTPASLTQLRENVRHDPRYQQVHRQVRERANNMMEQPGIEYIPTGSRMLWEARKCLNRVSACAILALVANDEPERKRYADFAIDLMLTAARFPDWHPVHFLDTAEFSAAVAMGYDWLYQWMTPEQRKVIRTAIIEKGLRAGADVYCGRAPKNDWWLTTKYNWSQVCNGGLAVGALAVADAEATEQEMELAQLVLDSGLKSVAIAMESFAPDGGWGEGPMYWGYTLKYTAYYLAALQTATGSMHGLEKAAAFDVTGAFRIYCTGPTGLLFNFADSGDYRDPSPAMFFLAQLFDRPEYALHHREESLDNAFDLIWFDGRGTAQDLARLPPDKYFRHTEAVFLRSAWNDQNALWCALKGGDNATNHSHLDLGTFVLDHAGERFVFEMGPDSYSLPGFFRGERYTYYRLGTPGQNTPLINAENQPLQAKAPVLAFYAGVAAAEGGSAVLDLSQGYPMCERVWRGLAMPGRTQVILQDEMHTSPGKEAVDFTSGFHTLAAIALDDTRRRATLSLGEKKMVAEILEPAEAFWQVRDARPPEPENQNQGVSKLVATLPGKATSLRLVVRFCPTLPMQLPPILPLAQWPGWRRGDQNTR